MKRLIIIILIAMSLVSCAKTVEKEPKQMMPLEFTSYVESGPDEEVAMNQLQTIKTFTIRAVDKGFSPEVLNVNVGDRIGLYLTNTRSQNVETISINDHSIEDFYHTGNTIYVEFVADKMGEFDFGDDRANSRKGKLIVN